MDFDLNDEQRELRDTARRFLERHAPVSYARAMMDDERGYSDEVWKQIAELGWIALALPERHGGLDAGFIALAIVQIELGRVVFPGPFFSTVLGALAIADAGSEEQRARLLPSIAAGDRLVTFAHEGRVDADGDTLRGTRRFVSDGHLAGVVVTPAHEADGTALVLAEPAARERVNLIDGTRIVADLSFDGARFERLGEGDARDAIRRALDRGAVMLAAEMLGAAERALELSVEYAKQRVQFGRPIGSFQAVKHRLADMLVDVESMRNAVYYAAWALERGHPDAPLAAAMAKACASDAAPRVTAGAIQVHGGIGFTWEHDLHLYYKRASASAAAFGDAVLHRERVARLLRDRSA